MIGFAYCKRHAVEPGSNMNQCSSTRWKSSVSMCKNFKFKTYNVSAMETRDNSGKRCNGLKKEEKEFKNRRRSKKETT
jgi:hypothetical protein